MGTIRQNRMACRRLCVLYGRAANPTRDRFSNPSTLPIPRRVNTVSRWRANEHPSGCHFEFGRGSRFPNLVVRFGSALDCLIAIAVLGSTLRLAIFVACLAHE